MDGYLEDKFPLWGERKQGSLHYAPEHCLVNGGFPLFWWKKPCFNWLQNVSFKEPWKTMSLHLAWMRIGQPPPACSKFDLLRMDEIHFAPPKKPNGMMIPLQLPTNHYCFNHVSFRDAISDCVDPQCLKRNPFRSHLTWNSTRAPRKEGQYPAGPQTPCVRGFQQCQTYFQ